MAITTSMEIMHVINRKMSIAILSKTSFLGLFSCDLTSIWLFCLYYCTNLFSIPGSLSNLLLNGVACNEIEGLASVLSNSDLLPNLVTPVLP